MREITVKWRPYSISDRVDLAEVTETDGEQHYQLGFLWRYPDRMTAEPAIGDDNEIRDEAHGVRLLRQLGEVLAADGDLEAAIAALTALRDQEGA